MTVRQGKAEDAAQIARVHVESWQTTYRGMLPDELLDNLSCERRRVFWLDIINEAAADKVLLVAEDDAGQVVGFVSGGPAHPGFAERYHCELQSIYLLASAQGQGLGRELVEAFAQWATDHGYQSMLLWTLAENTKTRAFYEHMGGTLIAESELTVGSHVKDTVAYGWPDLTVLV